MSTSGDHPQLASALNFRITGGAERPWLVLLHGFMGSGADWAPLLSRLESRFRCLVIDLPGHGASRLPEDWGACAMGTTCGLVIDVLDRVGVSAGYLWGYSLGGRVAMNLLTAQPEQFAAVVLESASPGIAEAEARRERADADDALALRLETEGLARFLEYWYRLPIFGSLQRDPALPRLLQMRLRNDPHALGEILRRLSPGRTPWLWSQLTDITRPPTLFVAGAEDEKYCAIGRRLSELNPTIRFEPVSQCGHSVHIQRPAALARIVLEFLQEVEGSDD